MARRELTKSKANEYHKASKRRKGVMLDVLCEDTGWSRDNARRQLRLCYRMQGKQRLLRKSRTTYYSARARTILANAWALSGQACGQYFVAQVADGLLERLVNACELHEGFRNKGRRVLTGDDALTEIKAMSSATIDRYLKGVRKSLEPLSKSTTKRSNYALRNEIPFGKSYEAPNCPGHLSTDTVAHCGNTLKGEHLWTLNSTDVFSGWSETITVKNKAQKWIKQGHEEILDAFPFKIRSINYDSGAEFINRTMIDYSHFQGYQMTRSRPYHSNDNAHVEQKNGDIVRKYAFRFRYEGQSAQNTLNQLWYWVNLRKNYLVPCRKCIGHTKTKSGRTRGIYDRPKTPYRRVMESEVVTQADKDRLQARFAKLNDAKITRAINRLQQVLLGLTDDADLLEFAGEMTALAMAA